MLAFNSVKNAVIDAYEVMKNEAINLFNGTTFLKIFNAGWNFFQVQQIQLKKQLKKIDNLIEQVKELHKTIESSKFFIHTIIEKVKETGRLKVVNKLNKNPLHPEYESSFPDLHEMVLKNKV